jgi:hypothetical protein
MARKQLIQRQIGKDIGKEFDDNQIDRCSSGAIKLLGLRI